MDPNSCSLCTLECLLSSCGTQDLVSPQHVESTWTRDQTHVPCLGRQTPIHCLTREVLFFYFWLLIFILDFFFFFFFLREKHFHLKTSLVAQMVNHLSAMQEIQVCALGQEDPVEKEWATHSSTLAWKILWMEEPVRLQSMGSQRVGHD